NTMSATLTPPAPEPADSLADLLDKLGNVPLSRIRTFPYPGSATEEDVLTTKVHGKAMCELIEGVLVEKAMGYSESLLACFLIEQMNGFTGIKNPGLVTGEPGMLRLWPGRVQIPEIAFIPWDRLPGRRVPRQPVPAVAPDLAIEVLSESNTPG